MPDLILIPHREICKDQLEEIIKIKSQAWPFSFDKQMEWITVNLNENDIHVLLSANNKYVAYLNLIKVKFRIDKALISGFGIGNVCSVDRGKGWGSKLLAQTNLYLKENNSVGLLFCKNVLVKFYSLNSWSLISKDKITTPLFDNGTIETMIYNYEKEFSSLVYPGKPF